jgi:hypothetical protein
MPLQDMKDKDDEVANMTLFLDRRQTYIDELKAQIKGLGELPVSDKQLPGMV